MTVEPAKEEVNSTESDLTVSETAEPPATITEPEVKGVDEQPEGESDGVEDSDEPDVTSTIVSILQSYQEPDVITPIQTLNEPYAFPNSRSDTVDIPDEVEKGEQQSGMNLQEESDIVDGVSSSDYLKAYLEMMEMVKPRRKPNVIGVTKKQREKEAGTLPAVNKTPGFWSKAERIIRKYKLKKKRS